MKELGLNLDQYSKFLDIPKSITKKIINGNGEVVKDMEINNFLRKNLFGKHQEVENNKEEKKVEALNIKLMRGTNSYEAKKQWLLENYPNSKEVKWYVNDYNEKEYFEKYNIQNRADLTKRYKFVCNEGRLKNQKEIGKTTIERLTRKKYSELGIQSAYSLICQLYDCFVNGNIKNSNNVKKEKRDLQSVEYTKEEQKMKKWYDTFDFKKFCAENNIDTFKMGLDLDVSSSTIKQIKRGIYRPSMKMIYVLKDYVDSFKNADSFEDNEINLKKWFIKFDLEKFVNEKSILYKDIAEAINIPYKSIYPMKRKTYIPNEDILKRLKDYVDSFETKIIPDERTAIVSEESIIKPFESVTATGNAKVFDIPVNNEDIMKLNNNITTLAPLEESGITLAPLYSDNEEILRNLLKDRLTEEEKTLIKIFGGRI